MSNQDSKAAENTSPPFISCLAIAQCCGKAFESALQTASADKNENLITLQPRRVNQPELETRLQGSSVGGGVAGSSHNADEATRAPQLAVPNWERRGVMRFVGGSPSNGHDSVERGPIPRPHDAVHYQNRPAHANHSSGNEITVLALSQDEHMPPLVRRTAPHSTPRYRIRNIKSGAFAELRKPHLNLEVNAFMPGMRSTVGDVWGVVHTANSGYTLQNVNHGLFAGINGPSSSEGANVVGKEDASQWVIQEVQGKSGKYWIAPSNARSLLWNHEDDEDGTPLTLCSDATNPRNQWEFIPA